MGEGSPRQSYDSERRQTSHDNSLSPVVGLERVGEVDNGRRSGGDVRVGFRPDDFVIANVTKLSCSSSLDPDKVEIAFERIL